MRPLPFDFVGLLFVSVENVFESSQYIDPLFLFLVFSSVWVQHLTLWECVRFFVFAQAWVPGSRQEIKAVALLPAIFCVVSLMFVLLKSAGQVIYHIVLRAR